MAGCSKLRIIAKPLTCLLILILLTVPVKRVNAQDVPASALNNKGLISISPPVQQLSLNSGLITATTTVEVTNKTNHSFDAKIKLVDFKSLGQAGGLTLGQVGVPLWKYGLANWMTTTNGDTISLASGASTKLAINIDNRADLTPGGHYGAVVISAESPNKAGLGADKVDFSQNLVSLLFVKKLGGEKYGLQLKAITSEGGFSLPQTITTTFSSTGNVYVIPRGYIEVTDPIGKLVERGTINDQSTIIMQGSSSKLVTFMRPVLSSDTPGRYKITVHYRYDGQAGFQSKSMYFTKRAESPIIITVIGVITGITIAYMLYRVRRTHKKYRRHHS